VRGLRKNTKTANIASHPSRGALSVYLSLSLSVFEWAGVVSVLCDRFLRLGDGNAPVLPVQTDAIPSPTRSYRSHNMLTHPLSCASENHVKGRLLVRLSLSLSVCVCERERECVAVRFTIPRVLPPAHRTRETEMGQSPCRVSRGKSTEDCSTDRPTNTTRHDIRTGVERSSQSVSQPVIHTWINTPFLCSCRLSLPTTQHNTT